MTEGVVVSTTVERRPRVDRSARWRVPIVLALAAGLVGAAWWWTHPDLMRADRGEGFVANPQPFSPRTAVQHYGFVLPLKGDTREVVTLERIEAHFAQNSAAARASTVLCTRKDVPEGTLTAGIGGDDASLDELCTEVEPVRPGTRLRLEGGDVPRRYLVWRIEATRPGTWRLTGGEVQYQRSWRHLGQRGTEHVASDIEFTFE